MGSSSNMSKRTAAVTALCILSSCLNPVNARCSHDVAERGLEQHKRIVAARESMELEKRQSPIDEAQERTELNPQQECSYYSSSLVNSVISSYPAIWEIATIVQGDQEATDAYNKIISDPNFPNIPPKGTPAGDFSGVNYNNTDPDCWWTWSKCDTPKHANLPSDVTSCPEPSTWGLTFDDGPNCTHNAFYDYLQQNDYTATLYYIGSNVADWPYQAQRGLADGHEIGVHTWSHRYATALTSEQFFAELWYTRKIIKDVIGITPTTWRAPYGDVDDRIRFIAHSLGLTTVLWDHDTFDWQIQNSGNPNGLPTASVVANYDQVFSESQQGQFASHGVIVLTHEIDGGTMDLAMSQLPQIASNFKHVVPVTTCQNISHPYVEQNYTFPTFAQWISGTTKMSNTSSIGSNSSSATSSSSTSQATIGGQSSTMGKQSGSKTPSVIGANNAAVTSTSHTGGAGRLTPAVLASVALMVAVSSIFC